MLTLYERNAVSITSLRPAPTVSEALNEEDIRRCWPIFHELRPHLTQDEFIRRWQAQRAEGYQIVFIESDATIVAAAGFRCMNTMAWGKILYLDDLIALHTQHGRGWGSALLMWLQGQARDRHCDAIHLDTGYHRHAAHKAYLRNGFELNCHHLAWKAT
jgi:GNAT superfamily N-acetyltransferase